jgi:ABC-2 type transport system ATP-binding protein
VAELIQSGRECLVVRGLTKSFGARKAVDGVSFGVKPGICYGLLGPNGAGKTTTLSIITGALDADLGDVTLFGSRINLRNLGIKNRIGYVPQDIALYEDLNPVDNLEFFGRIYQLVGSKLSRRIDEVLEIAQLSDRRKESVREFSGGMKRRLNIAISLLHEPDFLVFDEPTVGVDPQSRNLIFDVLERLRGEGKTILYTTHYMEEVERLCQRIAIMDKGQIVAEGTLAELLRYISHKTKVRIEFDGSKDGREFVELELSDLSQDLPSELERIAKSGGKIHDVSTSRTTLEQVFLHLTGHALRD